jgi:hypothetical protein
VNYEEFPAIVTARVFPLSNKPEDVVIVVHTNLTNEVLQFNIMTTTVH